MNKNRNHKMGADITHQMEADIKYYSKQCAKLEFHHFFTCGNVQHAQAENGGQMLYHHDIARQMVLTATTVICVKSPTQ